MLPTTGVVVCKDCWKSVKWVDSAERGMLPDSLLGAGRDKTGCVREAASILGAASCRFPKQNPIS